METRKFSTPLGPLFKHLSPGSIDGLTTEGWDREIFTGCFSIINVDFWFSKLPSDYVRQILKSGGDMEQRWTEQVKIVIIIYPKITYYQSGSSKYDKIVVCPRRTNFHLS
jgi:hypothetical protein